MPSNLPIYSVKQDCQDALAKHGCCVVSAPTGSGKSTQVPKFILETLPQDNSRILVLQPRRLAARMLAERLAFELDSTIGDTVGFLTRYEQKVSASTRILFITEGILTKMLVDSPTLPNVAAIVFDEFHERSLNTDIGFAMAVHSRKQSRPDLKLVVMSATIEATPICQFLDNCPHIHAEGRIHPINILYLKPPLPINPFKGATNAIRQIIKNNLPGDILVFMPGAYEINKTIEECRLTDLQEKLLLLPLYGDLPPEKQREVMDKAEVRKVIVATNIAETSLTIPGVRHVIDSGLVRMARFEPARGIDILSTKPIARDAADQRAGRAGREAPGTCQRLWTEVEQNAKPSKSIPEIQRLDLADTILNLSAFGFNDPSQFNWFENPPPKMLAESVALLEKLNLLKPNFKGITPLGRKLQAIPAHPRLALLIYLGAQNNCLNLAATAAAIISERPLVTNFGTNNAIRSQLRQNAKSLKKTSHVPQSDFINLFNLLQVAKDNNFNPKTCQEIGVHHAAARDVDRTKNDLVNVATKLGWTKTNSNKQLDDEAEFLLCILKTFPDKIAKRKDQGTLLCEIPGGKHATLDKNSVARDEPLIVAAEIREASGNSPAQGTKLILSLASGIQEQWLWDEFPDEWQDVNEIIWDEKQQRVVSRYAVTCLGLVMEETIKFDPGPELAAPLLAQKITEGKLNLPNWSEDVEKWIARVRWTAETFPDHPLPKYDETDKAKIVETLCAGETSYKAVMSKPCLDAVRNLLKPKDILFVEAMAPAQITLPKGRRMKIDYVPGQPPKGRARIQDIYDMTATIRVANGRVPILMDILAPNNRTVQITQDMESFWSVQYPKIKPALSRRYPKHEWR